MTARNWSMTDLLGVIEQHWGYGTLRPLQEQAMRAVLDGRDSLVVLPTGGGKSLCYQAPAVLRGDTTVVVSPLISLMKDQVDSLRACGVPAVQIDSSLSGTERFAYEMDIRQGAARLVFVSPERLVLTDFYRLLQDIGVKTFAIDEAHCISHWGHDFRPEYRQLSRLRELFPGSAVHAYTATATERVRKDIIEQLGLQQPEVLVGNFDRANLVYRVIPRRQLLDQVLDVIGRHTGEAGIIYCIRRLDVDDLTASLLQQGIKAMPYHAGLTPEQRRATQEAFRSEQCDLIVATVAFGMGIDRSNVRFVLHAAMPKSVEHYQQESGRAGRDGLEAECILLYSGRDVVLWKSIVEKSAEEAQAPPEFVASAVQHMNEMDRYGRGAVCRHRALAEYFGQKYAHESCQACDLCLGETEFVAVSQIIAQKILSCVARVEQRFGAGHVTSVLRGENTEKVRRYGHEKLSTYGLLRDHAAPEVRDWINQLIGLGVLVQEDLPLANGMKAQILKLNAASWEVMKGQREVRLVQVSRKQRSQTVVDAAAWEGVDAGLFEVLRQLRRQAAEQELVPPYVIFTDATLRQMARVRPSTLERMRLISGVGDARLRKYGERFLQAIAQYSTERGLSMDNQHGSVKRAEDRESTSSRPNPLKAQAFTLFRQESAIADVMHQTGRTRGTVADWLCEFIRQERPRTITSWVDDDTYQRVAAATRQVGSERLKPIFLALGETVSYDDIRLVVCHLLLKQQG